MLATDSTIRSEVFVADTFLQGQLCARLPGTLTGGSGGCTQQGAHLEQLSALLELLLKLACAGAHGLHVQMGHAGGGRPS